MLHPDDRDHVLAESDETNRTGEPFDIEYRIVAADGRIVWLHDHAVQVLDAEGRGRWQGVLQDVTDAHLAEDRLADAEQRYRAIVEHIPAAIYLDRPTDALETIYVSPQIADIMGVTPEEWIADPDLWRRLVVPEDREPTLADLPRGPRGGRELARRVPRPHPRRTHGLDPRRDDVPDR